MNITNLSSGNLVKYRDVKQGDLFRWVQAQDILQKTNSGHVYLNSGTHMNDNGNYDFKNVILLDHELIIKGEL